MLIEQAAPRQMKICFVSSFQQLLQQHSLLLSSFNKKNKWQLWVSERPMLKRAWIDTAGLDRQKVMLVSNLKQNNIISIIEKALTSKNYSYIAACTNQLNEHEKQRLQKAISTNHTYLFLVNNVKPTVF